MFISICCCSDNVLQKEWEAFQEERDADKSRVNDELVIIIMAAMGQVSLILVSLVI